MELVAPVPVEFEIIRPNRWVAVQLKAVRDPHAVQEEAATASHPALWNGPCDQREPSGE